MLIEKQNAELYIYKRTRANIYSKCIQSFRPLRIFRIFHFFWQPRCLRHGYLAKKNRGESSGGLEPFEATKPSRRSVLPGEIRTSRKMGVEMSVEWMTPMTNGLDS